MRPLCIYLDSTVVILIWAAGWKTAFQSYRPQPPKSNRAARAACNQTIPNLFRASRELLTAAKCFIEPLIFCRLNGDLMAPIILEFESVIRARLWALFRRICFGFVMAVDLAPLPFSQDNQWNAPSHTSAAAVRFRSKKIRSHAAVLCGYFLVGAERKPRAAKEMLSREKADDVARAARKKIGTGVSYSGRISPFEFDPYFDSFENYATKNKIARGTRG